MLRSARSVGSRVRLVGAPLRSTSTLASTSVHTRLAPRTDTQLGGQARTSAEVSIHSRALTSYTVACAPSLDRASSSSAWTPPSCAHAPGSLYAPVHRASVTDPNAYWLGLSHDIHWTRRGTKALSYCGEKPWDYRWFANSGPEEGPTSERWETNASYNMLDVHVAAGLGDKTALIYDSAVTGVVKHITYSALLESVSLLAGALKAAGAKKGDRILIYMPMVPETIQAMLAALRLGCVHTVVFGGFPAAELAKRIRDAQPTFIMSASCGIESSTKIVPYKPALDEAIRMSGHTPKKVFILQRPQCLAPLVEENAGGNDVDWREFVRAHGKLTPAEPMAATDPLYILYTSGTTGMPKGVVRDTASIVALKASMHGVYGHQQDKVFWSASDLGWAVGHSYIVYGPLLQGTTSVLYEGKPVGTPDAGAFWRVIAQHKVSILFTAPTALRAIRKEDADGEFLKKYDLSHFEALFLAGERADPASVKWARDHLKTPVIDHWWQTESGWGIVGNPRGHELLPVKDGSATKPLPGWDVRVLDDEGHEVAAGVQGNLVVKLPLPPSGLHELWQNPARFVSSYMAKFPGYYVSAEGRRYMRARFPRLNECIAHD
jgi:propionyl-CoA synthetase